jgi:hypothetical protein
LIATISPRAIRSATAAITSVVSIGEPVGDHSASCGPHTGHAFGCA